MAIVACAVPMLRGQGVQGRAVGTCDEATLARPGRGVAYSGVVQNSDHRFPVTIPGGLVGWGAAPDAPFHGFTIYLDSGRAACLIFEIHLRVELPEDRNRAESSRKRGRPVAVGNRRGWETVESGLAGGRAVAGVNVSIELPREGYTNDASISLITPKEDLPRNRLVLDRFIGSFHFE